MNKLKGILDSCGINVLYTCSDGDGGYNELNEKTFEIYKEIALKQGFDEVFNDWSESCAEKHIIDMLHCLKIARKRLLLGDVTLNTNKIDHIINADKIELILLFGQNLKDKSSIAKMKNFYVIELFNFKNIENFFENYHLYEIVY